MSETAPSYLVTGVSGSGKSTLCKEFLADGVVAYDIDEGYASWVNRTTGDTAQYSDTIVMHDEHDWFVDKSKIVETLSQSQEPVWFFGSAHGLAEMSDVFDKVFVLCYPNESVLRERIANREDNGYGKAPGELEAIIGYQKEYEQRFIARGAQAIDCSSPLNEIVEILKRG